jgi:hypothetical protein
MTENDAGQPNKSVARGSEPPQEPVRPDLESGITPGEPPAGFPYLRLGHRGHARLQRRGAGRGLRRRR